MKDTQDLLNEIMASDDKIAEQGVSADGKLDDIMAKLDAEVAPVEDDEDADADDEEELEDDDEDYYDEEEEEDY